MSETVPRDEIVVMPCPGVSVNGRRYGCLRNEPKRRPKFGWTGDEWPSCAACGDTGTAWFHRRHLPTLDWFPEGGLLR